MPEQFESGTKFDGKKTRYKTSMPKQCTYTLRIDLSRSKSIENVLFLSFFSVPVIVPFSKFTVFKICLQKLCRFRVNGRPIRPDFSPFSIKRRISFLDTLFKSSHLSGKPLVS